MRKEKTAQTQNYVFLFLSALLLWCFLILFPSQAKSQGNDITQEMIDRARCGNEPDCGFSVPEDVTVEYILPTAECQTRFTGATTHVMIAPGRIGEIETFADATCIGQGCYYTMNGNYAADAGECVR
ncbi:MAG: hypothetical protein AAF569_00300 [Pseudomonadota bacterium]